LQQRLKREKVETENKHSNSCCMIGDSVRFVLKKKSENLFGLFTQASIDFLTPYDITVTIFYLLSLLTFSGDRENTFVPLRL